MFFKRIKIFLFIIAVLFTVNSGFSQNQSDEPDDQVILELGINLLERYFSKE